MLVALSLSTTPCSDGKPSPRAPDRTFSFLANDAVLAAKVGPFDGVELCFYMIAVTAVFQQSWTPLGYVC